MTHRLLIQVDSQERFNRNQPLTYRPLKLYSLFRKDTVSGRNVKDSVNAYSEHTAYVVFGERLAENPLIYSIRPVSLEYNEAK